MAGIALAPSPSVRSLRILLDLGLLFAIQVEAVTRGSVVRGYFQLWPVRQLQSFLGKKDLALVTMIAMHLHGYPYKQPRKYSWYRMLLHACFF